MYFTLDKAPPGSEILETERQIIADQIKRISGLDTLITFILIIISSLVIGLIVYWTTGQIVKAGLSATIFPILGLILTLSGITKGAGFRSAALKLTDLKNELISLAPVSKDSIKDIETLRSKYNLIESYQKQIERINRLPVNGELAMYWEFDASTLAKTARGRDYLERARDSVDS